MYGRVNGERSEQEKPGRGMAAWVRLFSFWFFILFYFLPASTMVAFWIMSTVRARAAQGTCPLLGLPVRGQRATLSSSVSPCSFRWAPGKELSLSGCHNALPSHPAASYLFIYVEKGSHCIAQAGLKLMISWLMPLECWITCVLSFAQFDVPSPSLSLSVTSCIYCHE